MARQKSEIKDIFNGEYLTVWEDGEFVFMSLPYATVNIPKEEWIAFKKDIEKLSEI